MKIENREVDEKANFLDPVTYVPSHAKGNASHPDCELGVIIGLNEDTVRVLYFPGRTVQQTNPANLVWG